MPKTGCEKFVPKGYTCFDSDKKICLNWYYVILAIVFGNLIQILFETSLLYSLEVTYKPTELDKLADPDGFDIELAEQSNPDSKKELECAKVMTKCYGELLFLLSYLITLLVFIVGFIFQFRYGKPLTILLEFAIAFGIDQAKNVPC